MPEYIAHRGVVAGGEDEVGRDGRGDVRGAGAVACARGGVGG